MVAEGQTQTSNGEEVELLFLLLLLLDHPQHNIMLNVNEPPYKLPIFPLSHSFIQSQPSLLAGLLSAILYCTLYKSSPFPDHNNQRSSLKHMEVTQDLMQKNYQTKRPTRYMMGVFVC